VDKTINHPESDSMSSDTTTTFRWQPPDVCSDEPETSPVAQSHSPPEKADKDYKIYLIFSQAKDDEPWYNVVLQKIAGSNTLHVTLMLQDGKMYSVNQRTNTLEHGQTRLLRRNHTQKNKRNRMYFSVTLDRESYKTVREMIDHYTQTRMGYDNRFYYTMGALSWFTGNQCIGNACTTADTLTCSRMVYDILRAVRVLDPETYDANDGILAGDLETIVEGLPETFHAEAVHDVTRRLRRFQKQAGIVIS